MAKPFTKCLAIKSWYLLLCIQAGLQERGKNAANKTLLALPPVAGTLTRGLARFARILAHVLAPQSLALCAMSETKTIIVLLAVLLVHFVFAVTVAY